MADEYIRRDDAIRLAEQGQAQGFPWQFQMLVRLLPADVVPVSAYKQVMLERDTAVEQLKQIGKDIREVMDDVVHLQRLLSSINVTEIKHGEWISVPEMWGAFDIRYYCSECGKDAIINNSERYVLSDYCPHCGAIMDNKRGNENG